MTPHQISALFITEHAAWMSASYADRSVEASEEVLRCLDACLFETGGVAYASRDQLVDFLARPHLSRQSKATYLGHIRRFYRERVAAQRLALDPTVGLRRPPVRRRKPRPAPDDVLTRILAEAAEPYRLWALLAAYAGLRCDEIARLDRDDIDEKRIRVLGKGDKDGVVRTHHLIWQAVRDLPPGPVVRHPRGVPATGSYVSSAFFGHMRRHLGLTRVGLHRLRHWYATTALRGCGNLRVVQEMCRHEDIASTTIYTLVLDEDLEAAVAALPDLTGPAA